MTSGLSGGLLSGVRKMLALLAMLIALVLPSPSRAVQPAMPRDHWIMTSDGVRLHYVEAGVAFGPAILFVPGWAMPAWIWEEQIRAFSSHYHVFAMDPRGQGRSGLPASGYEPVRRGKDIAEVIAALPHAKVTIVGWSLGVLDTLAFVRTHGDRSVAGLVLVDNSVGEEPAPMPPTPVPPALSSPRPPPHAAPRPPPHAAMMKQFVHAMFHRPRDPAWLDRLVRDCLRLPEPASKALLAYPVPRTYWKEAVYATTRPVLYVVRPRWAAQAENLARNRPGTEIEIFTDAGHALFIDEASRFNTLLDSFMRRRIAP